MVDDLAAVRHLRQAHWMDPSFPMPMRERARRAYEALLIRVAHALPRRLVMWCAIRVMANATTGEHSNQVVPELLAMDALERWGCN